MIHFMENRASMRTVIVLLISFFSSSVFSEELPGIGFDRTRIIFMEKNVYRGVAINVINNTNNNYLLQSRVTSPDAVVLSPETRQRSDIVTVRVPFLAIQPLVRMAAHEHQAIRILKTEGTLLPDRESVFLLTSRAIPEIQDTETEHTGQIHFAVATSIKIFYRPKSLPTDGLLTVRNQITFKHEGNILIVNNSSPFWLTFANLEIDGKLMKGDVLHWMVPPKDSVRYPLKESPRRGIIRWRLLDETGRPMQWEHGILKDEHSI